MNLDKKLRNKDILSIADLEKDEIELIFKVTEDLKKDKYQDLLKTKILALIFHKLSTRTRVSFEAGMYHLGGNTIFLSSKEIQLKRGETVEDTARVLSRYVDGVVIRTFEHDDIVRFAKASSIPVINGLTDLMHPCQVISDLFTIKELKGKLKGLKIVFLGDGANNLAHSWLFGAAKTGLDLIISAPAPYWPDKKLMAHAKSILEKEGHGSIEIDQNVERAVSNADIIYTDVWTSMGQEEEEDKRKDIFGKFQVNASLMSKAKKDAVFMHCLPAHRGEEVTEDVLESPQSVVFPQAENRMHVQKAIITLLMRGRE
ncbi:MAG: ornithine carbamoyltransferase [Candidatus Aureabacteria bacterium]|nr:ornithine carbamoyltransferase [Candidatus Auribacterota bacterium]